jgi:organic radical activating enzyme
MGKKLIEILAKTKYLAVTWQVNNYCNFKCSYCNPGNWSGTEKNDGNLGIYLQNLDIVISKYKDAGYKHFKFFFSGGEPTVNKHFLDWLRYLNACGHHVSLHSNGSRLPDYYREVIHYGDLNLSVHFEFYDREKFINVVAAVTDEKAKNDNHEIGHLEVKFMMAPHDREEALILEEELRKIPKFINYCTWAIVPIRGGLDNNKNPEMSKGSGSEIMVGYTKEDYLLFGNRK